MDTQKVPFRTTALRFVQAVGHFMTSEVGWKARLMFAGLVALLCGINGLNVVNSYVGRNFMTSIANRDMPEFLRQAFFYVGVFAALTVVGVMARFAEERLALLWREFLTRRAVKLYLADATYYHLDRSGQLANPDQRIADDVRAFTVTTLSFLIMVLNSSLTILAFSGVLWTISPLLFGVAVLYAACGSYLTITLGRPLIQLNYDQLDKEANFRSDLIQVRENAEAILLARDERRLTDRLILRVDDLVSNFRRITSINRNVGFFTTGYNWMIQIIPALIIAPAFIKGEIDFGVITQSAVAFTLLVGAFSLIVTQFQSLSTFAAVVARLSSLLRAIEQSKSTRGSAVELVERGGPLAYDSLTLLSPADGKVLIKDLSISIPDGTRVLLTGSDPSAGVALLRATAGVRSEGAGRILRPYADELLFLAQRPYMPRGSLRQILTRTAYRGEMPDDSIFQLLRELELEYLAKRAGGLDVEQDWGTSLSLREQQLLAFIDILLAKPRLVFLDHLGPTLGSDKVRKLLSMLSENSVGCVNMAEADEARRFYDAVLDFGEQGAWTWTANQPEP
ncbi:MULTISPECIES: ABC transporter ATP-binding protein/permease [unclassified Sinorhizobium]|uniref:ABC transporter ATP-binding protein/permease n=1 Tax=unclassified Sinorhizobium TaxID=2613772 RepID=UPI003525B07A